MIPYVEVSHLPSSSSFFSAILQPLGLQCIVPHPRDRESSDLLSSVAYASDPNNVPVLHVRQSKHPLKPPRLSSVLLSAPSPSVVSYLHSCWLKADPPSWSLFRNDRGLELLYDDREQALRGPFLSKEGDGSVTRAIVYDHDGNRIEIVHHHLLQHRPYTPCVLDWKHNFQPQREKQSHISPFSKFAHKLNMAPSQSQSHSSHATSSSVPVARTRAATSQETGQSASPRENPISDGLNTTTVVGALLGVAAGAALTYGFVSNNSSPSRETPHRQESEPPRGQGLPRRATFPERPVTGHYSPPRYEDVKKKATEYSVPRRFADTGFQSLGPRGGYRDGDSDRDDDVDYGVTPVPQPPRYLTRGPPPKSDTRSRASSRTRPIDDIEDTRSRLSTRSVAHAHSTRARSEMARERVSLPPSHDWERRSHAPSRRSVAPESVVSRPPLSRTHRSNVEPDRESYVSARSHRSKSTARPPARESRSSEYETVSRHRDPSQVSQATIRNTPRELSIRASSHVSARRVPLPRSAVGSSHANWDPWEVPLPMSGVGSSHANWDDDMISLAPSDSISCAGSKRRSRKGRH